MQQEEKNIIKQILTSPELNQIINYDEVQYNIAESILLSSIETTFYSTTSKLAFISAMNQDEISPEEFLENLTDDFTEIIDELKEEEESIERIRKLELFKKIFAIYYNAIQAAIGINTEVVNVLIQKLKPEAIIPEYNNLTDSGCDVFAIEDYEIGPGETYICGTGLRVQLPHGYGLAIRPRSGISSKTGIRVANAPATIDQDYRGEIGIILHNINTEKSYTIEKGMKVAQLILEKVPKINWVEVDEISTETGRGINGFGASGGNILEVINEFGMNNEDIIKLLEDDEEVEIKNED